MEAILRAVSRNLILGAVIRNTGITVGVILLVAVGVAYISILGMSPEEQKKLLWTVQDFLPIIMFLAPSYRHSCRCHCYRHYLL